MAAEGLPTDDPICTMFPSPPPTHKQNPPLYSLAKRELEHPGVVSTKSLSSLIFVAFTGH